MMHRNTKESILVRFILLGNKTIYNQNIDCASSTSLFLQKIQSSLKLDH